LYSIINNIFEISKNYFNYNSYLNTIQNFKNTKVFDGELLSLSDNEKSILTLDGITQSTKLLKYHHVYETPDVYISKLDHISIYGDTGAFAKNGYLFKESYLFNERAIASNSFRNFFVKRKRKKQGVYLSLFSFPYAKNPYHIMIDDLPRLLHLSEINDDFTFIIPKWINEKYRDIVVKIANYLGIADIEYISDNECWIVDHLYVISTVTLSNSGFLNVKHISFMQKCLISVLNIHRNKDYSRIYISRMDADKRKVLNEELLYPILLKFGFKILILEEMSIEEQLSCFYSSEYIVGPHGAGLHNLFMSNKPKVIEIQPKNYIKPHFMFLTKAVGGEYKIFLGNNCDEMLNYNVDLELFEKAISSLLHYD